MIDVAVGVGFLALVLLGVGVRLVAARPQEPIVRRPIRVAAGVVAIGAGGYLVWLAIFLVSTPLI